MGKFMKGGPIVRGSIFERFLGRKMNRILGAVVESAIRLVVEQLRPGLLNDFFARVRNLKRRALFFLESRDALNLRCIENGVDAPDQTRLGFSIVV